MLGFLEYASGGLILLRRALLLHERVSSLRSRKGIGLRYGYTSERGLPVAAE